MKILQQHNEIQNKFQQLQIQKRHSQLDQRGFDLTMRESELTNKRQAFDLTTRETEINRKASILDSVIFDMFEGSDLHKMDLLKVQGMSVEDHPVLKENRELREKLNRLLNNR